MAKTYTFNASACKGGALGGAPGSWSGDWNGFSEQGSSRTRIGRAGANYYAVYYIFATATDGKTTYASLQSKTISSVTLTVPIKDVGTGVPTGSSDLYPIRARMNSSTAGSEAWRSTGSNLGFVRGTVSSGSLALSLSTSIPANGYTIGPGTYYEEFVELGTAAVLTVVTNETDLTLSYNANGGTGGPSAQTAVGTPSATLTVASSSYNPTRANSSAGSYAVTYNAGGGSVSPGSASAARTTSYAFSKWNTKSDGSGTNYNPGASITISANTTLYAIWSSTTTTAAVTLPTPSRTGYTFNGWYTAASGGTRVGGGGSSYTPTAAITLYAQWTIITYTVSYNKGSYGSGTNTTDTKSYNVDLTLKGAIFTRTGYTQTGWSTSDGGSKVYNLSGTYTANAAVTLYPFWTINTYTVSYNKGANGSGTNTSDTKTHGVNLTLKGAIFTRTGYTQDGWSTSDGGNKVYDLSGTYSQNAAVTLYPHWKIITYQVSYNAGGGTGAPAAQTKTYGVNLTLSSTQPTWAGHTFSSWNTAANGTGTSYQPGGTYSANAAATLYAIWDTVTYQVTYNANGGSGAPSTQTKTYGANLTLSSTIPTRTGYNFVSWNTKSDGSGTAYQPGGNYTANEAATLYAQWSKKTYAVTYNANGGTGAPSAQTKTYGETLTLSSTQPTRSGYTFLKWNTAENGSGTDYSPGGSYTANAAVTLYAQWTQSEYKVTYNSNGIGTAPAQQTKTYNVALTLAAAITAVGSQMTEWNTKADGTGTSYAPGGSYTANADVTLYAIWTAATYTITFNADGGTVSPASKVVTWGQPYGTLPTPTKDGETFYGWFDPDDVLITANSQVIIGEDTTLTAAWSPRSMMRVRGSDNQLYTGALYVKGSDNTMHMAVAYAKGSDGQLHING